MYNKNILQNGEKTVDSVLSVFSPQTSGGKDQMNVEVQKDNSNEIILNKDYQLPSLVLYDDSFLHVKENEKIKTLYNKAVENAQKIDYNQKKPLTYDGVDVDFGMPILDAISLGLELMKRVDSNGVAIIRNTDTFAQNVSYLVPDLKEYKNTGKISANLAKYANPLKEALHLELTEGKNRLYWSNPNAESNTLSTMISDAINELSIIPTIKPKGGQEAVDYMSRSIENLSNSVYEYTKGENIYSNSSTSKNAKKRLLENPWYVDHVKILAESSPELFEALTLSSEIPYITDIEKKIIDQISKNSSEVEKQKQLLEDQIGWEATNEIFSAAQENGSSFNDLLDMKWDLKKTALDDEIENTLGQLGKVGINYSMYLNSNIDLSSAMLTSDQKSVIQSARDVKATQTTASTNKQDDAIIKAPEKEVGLDIEKEKYNAKMDSSIEAYQMGMIDRAEVNKRRFER